MLFMQATTLSLALLWKLPLRQNKCFIVGKKKKKKTVVLAVHESDLLSDLY